VELVWETAVENKISKISSSNTLNHYEQGCGGYALNCVSGDFY